MTQYKPSFEKLWEGSKRRIEGTIIGVDPGHTTGLSRLTVEGGDDVILEASQEATPSPGEGGSIVAEWITREGPNTVDFLVVESYRVYGYKSDQHKWSSLHTSRLIGAIEFLAYDLGIPLIFQSASQAKGFVKNYKLQDWGLWVPGKVHAQDAIRHAVYFSLFGGTNDT